MGHHKSDNTGDVAPPDLTGLSHSAMVIVGKDINATYDINKLYVVTVCFDQAYMQATATD